MESGATRSDWGAVSLEPAAVTVGTYATWTVAYTVGQHSLEAGGDIRIRPYGNPLVRPPGQTSQPCEPNYVTVQGPPHVRLKLVCDVWLIVTVTLLEGRLVEGDTVVVTYGDRSQGSPGFGIKAVAHDLRFRLSVRPAAGATPIALPQRPLLRLTPDAPARRLAIAPSTVSGDQDFEVLVRCVDRFGNTVPSYAEPLRFAPVQGLHLPSELRLDSAAGAFATTTCRRAGELPLRRLRIAVLDREDNVAARSNPSEVNLPAGEYHIFWGDLHPHSNLEQGLESPEFLYEYARDQEKLDFIAHVEHQFATSSRWTGKHYKTWRGGMPDVPAYNADTWEYRKELIRKYAQPGRFVPLLGCEWAHNLYGHMNIYYPNLEGPNCYPRSFWDPAETPATVFRRLEGQNAIIIPHHPSAPVGAGKEGVWWATSGYDWDYYDPRLTRLVEIYSKWGSSEHLGCRRPLLNQQAAGTAQAALGRGYRLGFVAASDTHASRPGSTLYQDHTYAESGLTAVFAHSLDAASIYAALQARRCYATTGQRIILRFTLNGRGMGEEVALDEPAQPKALFIEAATPAQIETVEVLKNGQPFYRYTGSLTPGLGWWRDNGWEMAVRLIDKEPTLAVDYYYVRVVQQDGNMAWSSPIWVAAKTERSA